MPEEDFNFDLDEGIMDEDGNWYLEEDEGERHSVLSIYGNQSVYTKYELNSTIGTYDCDRNLVAISCEITEDESSATLSLVDITKTKASDYDEQQGVNFDSYEKGRQFVLICAEEDVLNEDLPADGDPYSNDKQVIFSGYNFKGASLDLSLNDYMVEFTGVEHLLNEIKISGCLIGGFSSPTITNPGDRLSNSKCIFNENSRPDRQKYFSSDNQDGTYRFNKSGIGNTEYWELQEILEYVVNFYCVSTSPLIALDENNMGLKMITYVSNYINVQWAELTNIALLHITPMDFSIEGMGVFDALLKIVAETKKFMIYKAYTTQGKCSIGFRNKYADIAERPEGDLPMVIDIGQFKAITSGSNVLESATIHMNRETKNIGRVIVLGDFLRINTLCTTINYPEFDANFSTNAEEFTAIGGLTSFIDRLSLVLTDTNHESTYQQNYVVVPDKVLDTTLADLGADLTEFNGEPDTLKIFEGLKCLEFGRDLAKGDSNDSSKSIRDIAVFIAHPSDPRTEPGDSYDYIYPLMYDGSHYYYFITPIESVSDSFSAKHDDSSHSSLIIAEVNGDNTGDTGLTDFGQYQSKSSIQHNNIAVEFFPNYDITKTLLLFARLNVKTDYRIKGIAQIDDYDEEIHSTMIVIDEDFKLTVQQSDAEYSAGSFTPLTDGYLEADDNNVLERLQNKADALLLKYKVIQNSGGGGLAGLQFVFKNGDWLDKFTGTGRDVNTPLVVRGVEFNFEEKTTTLRFGS